MFLYLLGGGQLAWQEGALGSQLTRMPVSPNAVCFNPEKCSLSAGSYSLGGPDLLYLPFGLVCVLWHLLFGCKRGCQV